MSLFDKPEWEVSEHQREVDRANREQFNLACSLKVKVKDLEEARERAFLILPVELMRHRRDGGDVAAERHFRATLIMFREDLPPDEVWRKPLPTDRTEAGLLRLLAEAEDDYQRAKARLVATLARLDELTALSGWVCNEGDRPTAEKAVADEAIIARLGDWVEVNRAFGPNTEDQEWASRVLARSGR